MVGASAPQGSPPRNAEAEFLEAQSGSRGQRLNLRGLLPSLVFSAAAPLVAYEVLTSRGMADAPALTISAIFPVIGIAFSLVRTRRVDMIGLISLIFIVVGVATSVLTGDTRFILIKESLLTGVFGLVCLVSLLLPRPLMFYFGRQFSSGGDPTRSAAFEAMWQYPTFRRVNRNITLLWGVGMLLEAGLRIALSFVLPIPVFLVVSPLLAFGITIALISATITYARRSARRGQQRLAALQSNDRPIELP
jgi:Intracellular septation protein A